MTAVEAIGLTASLLSLVLQVSFSYGSAAQRLQSFRAYSKPINLVRLRVGALELVFRNDCRRLLRGVIDDERELNDMLNQPTHSRWNDGFVAAEFESFLGNKDQVIGGLLHQMNQRLQEFHKLLADYDAKVRTKTFKGRTPPMSLFIS